MAKLVITIDDHDLETLTNWDGNTLSLMTYRAAVIALRCAKPYAEPVGDLVSRYDVKEVLEDRCGMNTCADITWIRLDDAIRGVNALPAANKGEQRND